MTDITTYGALMFVLAVGLFAAGAAYTGATHVYTDEDAVTVDYDTNQSVSPDRSPESFRDNETVRNASGSTLVEGVDYDWNTSTGSVAFYNTSNTSSGNTAEVAYAYDAYTDRTTGIQSVLGLLFRVLLVSSLIGGGLVVTHWLGLLPGGGGV